MPRQLRREFAGAIYHVMNRGDRREAIFRKERDRRLFLSTLSEACAKTGWQIHTVMIKEYREKNNRDTGSCRAVK